MLVRKNGYENVAVFWWREVRPKACRRPMPSLTVLRSTASVTAHYMMDGVGRVQFEKGIENVKKHFSITRSIIITFLI